jgi:hypothetical protein
LHDKFVFSVLLTKAEISSLFEASSARKYVDADSDVDQDVDVFNVSGFLLGETRFHRNLFLFDMKLLVLFSLVRQIDLAIQRFTMTRMKDDRDCPCP